jgi:tetratricopeptide (TPR) repeat protein
MQDNNLDRITKWFPLALLAAAVVAYANSFPGPFIFDDSRAVTNNPNVYTLWPPWKAVLVPTRFVADLSFAVNFALSDLTAADYRITNVLIHVLGGWLLFGIMWRTLSLPRFADRFAVSAKPLGFAVAMLWVVHPLQTESVTYIAQRIEALMGLFYLLVFYCFIRGLDSPRPRPWFNASVAACAVGMGTKEIIVTVPLMLFLYDSLFVSTSWREALRARWKVYLAMLLTLGIFAMLFLMGMAKAMESGGLFERAITPWRYLMTQAGVIPHYLKLCFIPTSLCLSYRWPFAQSLAEVWRPALVVLGLLVITLWGLLRRRAFAFPLAWLFVILAPTSSVMPLADAAFEHRMYLPLAGVIALVVLGGYRASERFLQRSPRLRAWHPAVAILLAALVTVWFVTLTRARNLDYRSEDAIWRDVLKKRPDNYKVAVAVSGALIGESKFEEATTLLTNLFARLPDFAKMSFDDIQRQYLQNPSLPCVEYAMGHNNLGVVYLNQSRWEEAKTEFREAMRVFPANYIGYFNTGRIAFFQGNPQDAIKWWKLSLLKKKDDTDCLSLLASTYALQGDQTNAIKYYRNVLKWKPNHPFARSQLAWTLATSADSRIRNGQEALALARALPEMSGDASARAYDILAAALAETGRFEEAVACAGQALRLAPKATDVEQRLKLYQQRQPYHESR